MEDIYVSLIVRFLKNEISETEKQELFHWVYQNSENEKLFYNLKDVWQTIKYDSITKNLNTNSEWEKLALKAMRTKTERFKEKKSALRIFYRVAKIAAVFVLLFLSGFFVHKLQPEKINYATVNVPYGAKSKLELPDGSEVWVNSGSSIKYPTNMDQKEVTLHLEGEAYFDIAKNPKRTLNVRASTINIQVHGTTFNVKSYTDEDIVETTLLEGSVSITGSVGDRKIKEPIYLKPNEQATLIKGSLQISDATKKEAQSKSKKVKVLKEVKPITQPHLQIKEGINPEDFVMWKNNVLSFDNERFESLSLRLERWYDVEITIESEELKNSRYTGTFEKETIEQAMAALSLSLPFKYKMKKNQITIVENKH